MAKADEIDKGNMKVEIYGLYDPFSGGLKYIGKARNSKDRLKSHIRDARRRKTPVYHWINGLALLGCKPIMVVICETDDWRADERSIIASARLQGAELLNVASGGDEPHCPVSVRRSNGRKVARMVHDDPVRKRIWALRKDLATYISKGWVRDATLEKIKLAAIRRPDLFGGLV